MTRIRAGVFVLLCLLLIAVPAGAQSYTSDKGELNKIIARLCALLPDNPDCRGTLKVRCESDEGDVCTCGEGKDCQATPTGCACFKAEDSSSNQTPRRISIFTSRPPPPSKATLDVKCGDDTYTISTGNDAGSCGATAPGKGGGGGGSCSDGTNGASANCDTGCVSSAGSGSCTGP